MDPLKLLSRSTRKRKQHNRSARDAPSSGQDAQPQLSFESFPTTINGSRKRKRDGGEGAAVEDGDDPINFFGRQEDIQHGVKKTGRRPREAAQHGTDGSDSDGDGPAQVAAPPTTMSQEGSRRILKQHKLKVTWLNPPRSHKKERRKAKEGGPSSTKGKHELVPTPLMSFHELRSRYNISHQLTRNILDQGYTHPTEVQMAALPLLLDDDRSYLPMRSDSIPTNPSMDNTVDLLSIAPTGSGKTLAFMIPLLERLRQQRRGSSDIERHTSAIVLAPTKELSAQIVNEGRKLASKLGVKVTQMRKGMKFGREQKADEDADNTILSEDENSSAVTSVKADVIVSTPGVLQNALRGSAGSNNLSQVRYLVLDEADVLLDPLFKEQTLDIWNVLSHSRLRISMWSATMGSNVEELAHSTIINRIRKLQDEENESVAEGPLLRLIVGLKDSAAPNVEHKLLYAASEQGKLMGLRQLLHPTTSSHEDGPMLKPPFLVFTQTIERAVALHSELRYDIPAEAGGIGRIAVLHADLSTTARDDVMARFRKGSIWVLITTDLLSRGVDFRGVNGVVNYDIPGSSAAYIHRIGRTGRAGREGGIAVTLYSKEDMPYLKHIANVMAMAQRQRGEEASDTQKWLVDALPKLSKNEKQALKKHGVKSRSVKGDGKDAKTARRTKISTKAGYARQVENRRKGARAASQRMLEAGLDSDGGNDTDFAGFD